MNDPSASGRNGSQTVSNIYEDRFSADIEHNSKGITWKVSISCGDPERLVREMKHLMGEVRREVESSKNGNASPSWESSATR